MNSRKIFNWNLAEKSPSHIQIQFKFVYKIIY